MCLKSAETVTDLFICEKKKESFNNFSVLEKKKNKGSSKENMDMEALTMKRLCGQFIKFQKSYISYFHLFCYYSFFFLFTLCLR